MHPYKECVIDRYTTGAKIYYIFRQEVGKDMKTVLSVLG
jgi:hypothetical protein